MAMARGPQLHSSRRPRDWGPVLLCTSLLVWVAVSVLFASRLTVVQTFAGFRGDLYGPQAGGPAPGEHRQPQQQPISPVGQGLSNASAPSPAALAAKHTARADNVDVRVSGLGPALDNATLHGAWTFTHEMFDLPTKHPNATVVSWRSPRVLHIKDFLQPVEVRMLVDAAGAGFKRSEVVADGKSMDESRTSYGSWLNGERRTAKVREIQHRIFQLTQIPEEFGESLYVLRYATGQRYEAHTDHCHHAAGEDLTPACRAFLGRAGGPACGAGGGGPTCGDRLATLILYLQSPERGGATVFPRAKSYRLPAAAVAGSGEAAEAVGRQLQGSGDGNGDQAAAGGAKETAEPPRDASLSWYCQEDAEVLKVLPKAGDAVLFYDYTPSDAPGGGGLAQADPASMHAGCPPLNGTKLIATRWMRSALFT